MPLSHEFSRAWLFPLRVLIGLLRRLRVEIDDSLACVLLLSRLIEIAADTCSIRAFVFGGQILSYPCIPRSRSPQDAFNKVSFNFL